MNRGTKIEHVIAYLEKCKNKGFTHVVVETPDRKYDSFVSYNEITRKDEGVLILGAGCQRCVGCDKYKWEGVELK